MNALERVFEKGTLSQKIIAAVISFTLIFSLSNFFYGIEAFAEEPEGEKTETIEASEEAEATQNETASEDSAVLAVNKQRSAAASIVVQENDDNGSTEESEGANNEQQSAAAPIVVQENGDNGSTEEVEGANKQPESSTCEWNGETGTLTISGGTEINIKDLMESFLKENKIVSADIRVLNITDAKSISLYGFSQMNNLESVSISSVEEIGHHAFFKCPNLTNVTLKDIDILGNNAFSECDRIVDVSIQDIDLVGYEAFRHDDTLVNLTMKNIGSFERSPFSFCIGLKSVEINGAEDGISGLGRTMFYGCTGLKTVTVKNANVDDLQTFNGCTSLETATIENADLGTQAFYGCINLKTVNLNKIGSMGTSLLQNCDNRELTLTITDTDVIGEKAFIGCPGLKTVVMAGVGTVGKNAFASCKNLETATMNGIGTIGQYAFYNCTNLETVELSDVTSIANYAFWYCSGLKSLESLINVKDSIGGFAFYGCSSLEGLSVDTLTKMGYIGVSEAIMERVKEILAGRFLLDNAEEIEELDLEEGWDVGAIGKSDNWSSYENGTQIVEQATWSDEANGEAEVKVDAYYTGQKQMDYIFVADLSASMAQLGNPNDQNARFYDMQSKLLDMTSKLLNTPGYDCRVAIVSFGGLFNNNATVNASRFYQSNTPGNKDFEDAESHINNLKPLNENTDYGLGMREALNLVQGNTDRNTVIVFLSDGAPNANGSGDQDGSTAASRIKQEFNVPIYGVLHSPTASQHNAALAKMEAICNEVYKSTDTDSFGDAMNAAFAAPYGNNVVTVPVNADEFDISNLRVTSGTVSYSNGAITWELNGMPFTKHTLTYNMTLTNAEDGTYFLNKGDAQIGDNGASVGLNLALVRAFQDADEGNDDDQTQTDPVPGTTTDEDQTQTDPVQGTTTTTDEDEAQADPASGANASIDNDLTPAPAPTPTPTQTNPAVTPTTAAGGAAATAAGAAATPAAPAVVIPDDDTPLDEGAGTEIQDDENPLAAFDAPQCWTHTLMIIGIILTVLYGAVVVARRLGYARKIDQDTMGSKGVAEREQRAKVAHDA